MPHALLPSSPALQDVKQAENCLTSKKVTLPSSSRWWTATAPVVQLLETCRAQVVRRLSGEVCVGVWVGLGGQATRTHGVAPQ